MQHALETLRKHLVELKKALPAESNKDTVEMRASMLKGIEQHELALEVLNTFVPISQRMEVMMEGYRTLSIVACAYGTTEALDSALADIRSPNSLFMRAKACE